MTQKRLTPEELERLLAGISKHFKQTTPFIRGHIAALEVELECMRLRAMSAEGIANMRRTDVIGERFDTTWSENL